MVARKENNPLTIGLMQYLQPDYWSWGTGPDGGLLQQGADAILGHVVDRLEGGDCEVTEAYGIVHDKDQRQVWDQQRGEEVTELKPEHLHAVVKFSGRQKSAPLATLADLIGVEPQYVEKPGRGRYAYDNMLAYLTHAKYADQHQYAPSEVATVRGPDYLGVDASRRSDWLKGRAAVKKKRAGEDFEDVRERVLAGEVTREEIMLTDELFDVYARHQREIEDALNAYGQRRAYRAAARLRAGEFSTQVVFIYGESGVGKTRFATGFMGSVVEAAKSRGERWDIYRAATANPLDEWRGQEIIFFDDTRANTMDANDWLLLLDPFNASPARARYKNKSEVAPRLIVITNTKEPVEFFYFARQKGQVDEALDQFIRRLESIVRVYRCGPDTKYEVRPVKEGKPGDYTLSGVKESVFPFNPVTVTLRFHPEHSVKRDAEEACQVLTWGLQKCSPDLSLDTVDGERFELEHAAFQQNRQKGLQALRDEGYGNIPDW